jgi:cytochrome c oxidase cbb3-type subunit III
MKKATRWLALLVLLTGCDLPGKPDPANKFVDPARVLDFATLYAKNCAGCHGKDGKLGPAPPLNDGVFLGIAPENELAKVIAGGRKGTEMPAFAKEQGGTLTAEQVQALAAGLRKKWGDAAVEKKTWPAYVVPVEKGNADHGKAVFARVCATCHGQEGFGKEKQGPINDPAFLALASEQVLRRFVITGRADLGMPNCAEHEGGALTAPDVNDLVALMMSWKEKGTAKK